MRFLLLLLLFFNFSHAGSFAGCTIKPQALAQLESHAGPKNGRELDFYFYKGVPYSVFRAFTDAFLKINLTDSDAFTFYQGENCTEVEDLHSSDNRYFGLLRKGALWRSHQLNPFDDKIIGISTNEPYSVSINMWEVNILRLAVFLGGISLFLFASKLVRNVVFYYASGCTFGVVTSLLLVVFLIYRVAPKKTFIGLPILIGGWSACLYMLHFAWSNFSSIMMQHQKYVAMYFATVLLISMAVCYKRGPPTDARSHDIAQWTLQLIALALIYFSSQVPELSLAVMALLVLHHLSHGWLFGGFKWYLIGVRNMWNRAFPRPRKLLTEEEYQKQGRETTKRELDLLRDYCSNPENLPWQIVNNVVNANRLASFVQFGQSDVSNDERVAHQLSKTTLNRRDDDGDDMEEYDEVEIRTGGSPSSVVSMRLPRNVATRLLSPYQNLNRSLPAEEFDRRAHYLPNPRPATERRPSATRIPSSYRLNDVLRSRHFEDRDEEEELEMMQQEEAANRRRSAARDAMGDYGFKTPSSRRSSHSRARNYSRSPSRGSPSSSSIE
ncbi:unnamed protein product [Caenorhabditis auriculariae]|uniref:Nuclear envelope integral membrane protein 1 n=1 Tax=Caenorhabditis auriculariae TaxID=2777116 RepID=A0A8S1HUM4_9PELO|nr:unnamed protein product [Caenorhabditis auriculariae]